MLPTFSSYPGFLLFFAMGLVAAAIGLASLRVLKVRLNWLQIVSLALIGVSASLFIGTCPSRWVDAFRLTPSVAFWLRYPLLEHPVHGALIDWPYGPVAALAYLPAAFFYRFPLVTLNLAGITSFLLVAGASGLVISSFFRDRNKYRTEFISLVLLFLIYSLKVEPSRMVMTEPMSDSIALFLALLAVFLLGRYRQADLKKEIVIWSCISLAFWSKQTSLPLFILVPLSQIIWGRHLAPRLILVGAITFSVISVVMIGVFGWESITYSMFKVLPQLRVKTQLNFDFGALADLRSVAGMVSILKGTWEAICFATFPILILLFLLRFRLMSDSRSHPGFRLAQICFLFSIGTLPASVIARISGGGSYNSLAMPVLLLSLGVLGLMAAALESEPQLERHTRLAIKVFLVFSVVALLPEVISVRRDYQFRARWVAFRSLDLFRRHPNDAYDATTPFWGLVENKRLYHSTTGLRHRAGAGFQVDKKRLLEFLPYEAHFVLVDPTGFRQEELRSLFCPYWKGKPGIQECFIPEGLGPNIEKMSEEEVKLKFRVNKS